MAINKKLVHFKTFAKFNEELSAGNILDTSICWIKDTKQIWTHGQFYDCSSLTDEDIVGTALVGYAESVETNENLDLTAEDTIIGAFGKLVKAIKDNEEVDSAAFVKLRDSIGLDENLGFSTSAGDTDVTEAIERIDGKIITSGSGTKFLADNGQYKSIGTPIEAVGSSGAITQELSPNTYYKFGRCTSLTIALGAEVSGILNEYMFEFLSGVTPTVLNLPGTVKWNNGNTPTIEANKKYIVSIVRNIAVIGGV